MSLAAAWLWAGVAAAMLAGPPAPAMLASYYAHRFHGRLTASGTVYNMYALTAAHRTLAFGTRLLVTNLANGRSIIVTITDRGPFVRGRTLDLSYRAARQLGFIRAGLARIRMEEVD